MMTKVYYQDSHGLSLAEAVYRSGGAWVKSQADDWATLATGLVTRVPTANHVEVTVGGQIKVESHGIGADNAEFWLSQSTPGATTTTQPSTGIRQSLGQIVDSDNLILLMRAGVAF